MEPRESAVERATHAASRYINKKVTLLSSSDVRYDGELYTVDPAETSIALKHVICLGTQDRRSGAEAISASDCTYEFIIFRAVNIKSLHLTTSQGIGRDLTREILEPLRQATVELKQQQAKRSTRVPNNNVQKRRVGYDQGRGDYNQGYDTGRPYQAAPQSGYYQGSGVSGSGQYGSSSRGAYQYTSQSHSQQYYDHYGGNSSGTSRMPVNNVPYGSSGGYGASGYGGNSGYYGSNQGNSRVSHSHGPYSHSQSRSSQYASGYYGSSSRAAPPVNYGYDQRGYQQPAPPPQYQSGYGYQQSHVSSRYYQQPQRQPQRQPQQPMQQRVQYGYSQSRRRDNRDMNDSRRSYDNQRSRQYYDNRSNNRGRPSNRNYNYDRRGGGGGSGSYIPGTGEFLQSKSMQERQDDNMDMNQLKNDFDFGAANTLFEKSNVGGNANENENANSSGSDSKVKSDDDSKENANSGAADNNDNNNNNNNNDDANDENVVTTKDSENNKESNNDAGMKEDKKNKDSDVDQIDASLSGLDMEPKYDKSKSFFDNLPIETRRDNYRTMKRNRDTNDKDIDASTFGEIARSYRSSTDYSFHRHRLGNTSGGNRNNNQRYNQNRSRGAQVPRGYDIRGFQTRRNRRQYNTYDDGNDQTQSQGRWRKRD